MRKAVAVGKSRGSGGFFNASILTFQYDSGFFQKEGQNILLGGASDQPGEEMVEIGNRHAGDPAQLLIGTLRFFPIGNIVQNTFNAFIKPIIFRREQIGGKSAEQMKHQFIHCHGKMKWGGKRGFERLNELF